MVATLAVALALAACGAPDDAGPAGRVRERAIETTTTPAAPTVTEPAATPVDAAAAAEPPMPETAAPAPGAPAHIEPRRPPARAATASESATSGPAPPVVKQPPPRPNRSSEAPTQPPESAARPGPDLAPPAAGPRTTARYPQDFPDPYVFRAGAHWYAVSTQRGMTKVPVIRSADLVHWEERGDALAGLPRWSRFGALWAPSVLAVPAGFVLYYTTPHAETGLQCLSRAFSPLPDGPYVDVSPGPFVCQSERGGSIDPSPFRDADGRPWLTWKSEGTLEGEPTRIWSQRLTDDGRSLVGEPAELLRTEVAWEDPIVEGPTVVALGGRYHLFYSGNRWETDAYGTGHATCAGPAGPCARTAMSPVLRPHPSEAGAGGGEVFIDLDGTPKLAYHAWDPTAVGYPAGLRRLRIGTIRVDGAGDGAAAVEPLEV